jgi:hypothetical protein
MSLAAARRLPSRPAILAKAQSADARQRMTGLRRVYSALKSRDRRIDAVNARADVAERVSAARASRMEAAMSLGAQRAAEERRRLLRLYADAAALRAYATKRMRDLKRASVAVRSKLARHARWQALAARSYRLELKRGARAKALGRITDYEESDVETAAREAREGIAPVRQQL